MPLTHSYIDCETGAIHTFNNEILIEANFFFTADPQKMEKQEGLVMTAGDPGEAHF